MNIHTPERGENESVEDYKNRRLESKAVRTMINGFWNSFQLGTYDPEGKQPNNNFKAKRAKQMAKLKAQQEGDGIFNKGSTKTL